MPTEKIIRIVH